MASEYVSVCEKQRKMVNFKLGEEMRNGVINMTQAWEKEKIWVPTGIELMTFHTPVGCSI